MQLTEPGLNRGPFELLSGQKDPGVQGESWWECVHACTWVRALRTHVQVWVYVGVLRIPRLFENWAFWGPLTIPQLRTLTSPG